MKTPIFVLMTTLLLGGLSAAALAQDQSPEKLEKKQYDSFMMMKQDSLKDLDARIASLQKVRGCIADAPDHMAVKKCHEMEQTEMRSFMAERKRERVKRIEQQQKELEEEKQRLMKDDAKP